MAKGGKHRERELAFQVLYGLSFAPASELEQVKKAYMLSPHNPRPSEEPSGYAWELVKGAWQEEAELNAAIERLSHNWRPDRIGKIETLLLRLSLYEMFHTPTPPKVVISEALELAGQFGAVNAASFINGILDAAARERPEFAAKHLAFQKDNSN